MTHKQKVLALLRDGRPHTHHELYRLGCVAHSRISDLRRDGYTIEQWRDGENYMYRLAGPLQGYFCDDCGRRFFNEGWHAEACGSSNYARLTLESPVVSDFQGSPAAGGSSVDDHAPSSSSSSGRSTPSPSQTPVETSTLVSGQLVLNVPVSERERDLHVNGRTP